jgi:hypothetical protein
VRLFSEAEPPIVTTTSTEVTYKIQSEIVINLPQVTFINTANTIPTIENIFTLEPTLGSIETSIVTFVRGAGDLFIYNNATINAYASVAVSSYANVSINVIGTPKLLIGNNTVFTVAIPTGNTVLRIVDTYGPTANAIYYTDAVYSNTAMSIHTSYIGSTLSNGAFYVGTVV